MQDLERYTPEMLVYYNALEEPLKTSLRLSNLPVEDMESLAAAAEMLAQSGHAGNRPRPAGRGRFSACTVFLRKGLARGACGRYDGTYP